MRWVTNASAQLGEPTPSPQKVFMTELERLAKTLFEDFSLREIDRMANWNYLSRERKLAWMKDVLRIHNHIALKLAEKVKPVGHLSSVNTSWGMGFNEGVRSERITFLNLVESLHKNLEDDFQAFLEKKK